VELWRVCSVEAVGYGVPFLLVPLANFAGVVLDMVVDLAADFARELEERRCGVGAGLEVLHSEHRAVRFGCERLGSLDVFC
jgi:hypothetical protein